MISLGLLRCANELDYIEEIMEIHRKHFPIIYFMDDSHDGTGDVVRSYKEVVCSTRTLELCNHKRHGIGQTSQIAIDQMLKAFKPPFWVTGLCADEIHWQCPLQVLQRAEYNGWSAVMWMPMHFFLHSSQRDTWDTEWRNRPLMEKLKWYCPGDTQVGWPGAEAKQFLVKERVIFEYGDADAPAGVRARTNPPPYPFYLHCGYRNPEQAMERVKRSFDNQANLDDRGLFAHGPFLDCLEGLSKPTYFTGDFGEYEIPDLYKTSECEHC